MQSVENNKPVVTESKAADMAAEKRDVKEEGGSPDAVVPENGKLGADEKPPPVMVEGAVATMKVEEVGGKGDVVNDAKEPPKAALGLNAGAESVENVDKKPILAVPENPADVGENQAEKGNVEKKEGKPESSEDGAGIGPPKTEGQDPNPPPGEQLLNVDQETAESRGVKTKAGTAEEKPAADREGAQQLIDDDELAKAPEKQPEVINIDEAVSANKGQPEVQGEVPPAQDIPKSVPRVPIQLGDDEDSSSHFMTYFVSISILTIIVYVTYHNRKKILGLMLEGRGAARARRSRVNYSKLRVEPLAEEGSSGRPDPVRDFIY